MRWLTLLFLLLLNSVACPANSFADITLAKIFSDHMVLQREASVKVWGTADPGDKLVIKFNEQTTKATVDVNGRWSTLIKTPKAGGPYQLEVTTEKGDPKIVISDVMIGEVWVCSGQSNMEWPVTRALNPETEIEGSKAYSNIRLFTVSRKPSATPLGDFDKTSAWSCCSPESVKNFSAVAYFFARELSKKMDMPIGLIHSSWGGTRCEAWTSRAALESDKSLAPLLRHWDENDDPTSRHRPANLYNGMIAPLKGFAFRGVIWYQGEANVGRGRQYSTLFPTMISDWRRELGNGEEFPFYFVQLAPFRYNGKSSVALAEIWDAQLKSYQKTPGSGIVVTTDIGNVKDIHPKNKQEVGRRLALWALGNTYQESLKEEDRVEVFSGPIYESLAINNETVRVTFKHVGSGLKTQDNEALTNFLVCGEDRVFHPANAKIDGSTVVLTCEKVQSPVAVRFAWDDSAVPNLFNSGNLPASPFRTDNFELESKDVDY